MNMQSEKIECSDFLEFQDNLKKWRDLDDKMIYMLNSSLPTVSFRSQMDPSNACKELYTQLDHNYKNREAAIKNCISYAASRVKNLRIQHDENSDDTAIMKLLKKEQTTVRLLQSELNVEEVVQDRSFKLFYERCRPFYKPPTINIQ